MSRTPNNEERRNARRFDVDWEVMVIRSGQAEGGFDEGATLRNLSSGGALIFLKRKVNLGERLEVQIKVPFKKNNWMKYTAEVVRLGLEKARPGIGVRFDTPVPIFISR